MNEKNVTIDRYPIKLGQFLKLAQVVQDGLEAKFMILNGEVKVNGEVETRRGKQLQRSDLVTCGDDHFRCD